MLEKKEFNKNDELKYKEGLNIIKKLNNKKTMDIEGNVNESLYFPKNRFSLFVSHKYQDRKLATNLKHYLEFYGISTFVAHEDIKPSSKWIDEIKKALNSMDAFLVLLTEDFFNRMWTNQEIGFAYGKDKFILCLMNGEEPKGFIRDLQALKFNDGESIEEIGNKILIELLQNKNSREKMIDVYFKILKNMKDFNCSIKWGEIIKYIKDVNDEQMKRLMSSFNTNDQAYKCVVLTEKIKEWLNGKKYEIKDKKIIPIEK